MLLQPSDGRDRHGPPQPRGALTPFRPDVEGAAAIERHLAAVRGALVPANARHLALVEAP